MIIVKVAFFWNYPISSKKFKNQLDFSARILYNIIVPDNQYRKGAADMTIETLEKRIAGKQKAIEKLEKKIERIEAAKATNWEKNPYMYSEWDLTSANRDLKEEKEALQKYQDQLTAEQEKADSRNVKALLDFLETWKETSINFFLKEKERYEVAEQKYYKESKELLELANNALGTDKASEFRKARRKLRQEFLDDWAHIRQFESGSRPWEDNMRREIETEKNRKYDNIIERTNTIVGKITDASNLRVGQKGDLNGFIIGERGKAEVKTIGAGGWNIVRFHFRTLIHKID